MCSTSYIPAAVLSSGKYARGKGGLVPSGAGDNQNGPLGAHAHTQLETRHEMQHWRYD